MVMHASGSGGGSGDVVRGGCVAGVWAATAGLALKMAMGSMPVQLQGLNEEDGNAVAVVWMVRTVTAAVFMMANARMWVAFSAALAASESAFVPTIVNFVINSITSTLLGFVVFGDAIVWQVALGNACMISGAVLLLSA